MTLEHLFVPFGTIWLTILWFIFINFRYYIIILFPRQFTIIFVLIIYHDYHLADVVNSFILKFSAVLKFPTDDLKFPAGIDTITLWRILTFLVATTTVWGYRNLSETLIASIKDIFKDKKRFFCFFFFDLLLVCTEIC